MSKVLVDRELLERAAKTLENEAMLCHIDRVGSLTEIYYGLNDAIAHPAEAEGVSALDDLLALYPLKIDKQAFVINGGAPLTADGDDEFLSFKKVDAALGEIRLLAEQGRAALSAERARADVAVADANDAERALVAVTAERDRLLVDLERAHRATNSECMDWAREYERRKEVQAERDQLRAEVERYVPLHEAVQRAAGELPEGWAIQLYIERDGGGVELIGPDGTEDFATNNERLDYTVIDALEAAMAAKEA